MNAHFLVLLFDHAAFELWSKTPNSKFIILYRNNQISPPKYKATYFLFCKLTLT